MRPAVKSMRLGSHFPDHREPSLGVGIAEFRDFSALIPEALRAKAEAAVKRPAMVICAVSGQGHGGVWRFAQKRAAGEWPVRENGTGLVEIPNTELTRSKTPPRTGVDSSTTSDINRRWWATGEVPRPACVRPH